MRVAGLPVLPTHQSAAAARRLGAFRVALAIPGLTPPRRSLIEARMAAEGLPCVALPPHAPLMDDDALAAFVERPAPAGPPDCAAYRGATVLVTGAGGTIGSELARQLRGLGAARLILLDHSELALDTLCRGLAPDGLAGSPDLVPVLGSVTDEATVSRLFARWRIGAVLHSAACKHVPMAEANPLAALRTKVLGTAVLADAARIHGAQRFVLISTDKAARPAGIMGASKRLAEIVVQDHAGRGGPTRFSAVRFGNVLCSSGSMVPAFRDQIAAGGPLRVTDPGAMRYLMTADEAAGLVLRAGDMASEGEILLLDMGAPVRVGDIALRLAAAAGRRAGPGPDGIAIRVTGLRPGEKRSEDLSATGETFDTICPRIRTAEEPGLTRLATAAMLRDLRAASEAGSDEAAVEAAWRALGVVRGTGLRAHRRRAADA